MTKRSSSGRSSKGRSAQPSILVGIVLVIALGIVTLVLYGPEAAITAVSEAVGVDPGGLLPAEEPGAPEGQDMPAVGEVPASSGSGGSFYTIQFAEPINPWDESLATNAPIETSLIELINGAQSTIDLAVFEFNRQPVADALLAAHNRGVRVRIVYDDEHTEEDPQMEEMIDAGIPATPDERSAFMHNKFFIFDGLIVWTGSTNVTINDMYRNNNNAVTIRSSQLAANYTANFEEMFNGEFGPTSSINTPNPVFTLDGIRIENYFSPEDEPIPALVALIDSAQTSVHFMAFSYTHVEIGDAMQRALTRGVEVTGVFETRGANTESSRCPPLRAAGADVRLDGNPRTFHHKVIIVDGATVAIGSFNFSANATDSNDENLLILYDPAAAAQYEQEFSRRMAEAIVPSGSSGCQQP